MKCFQIIGDKEMQQVLILEDEVTLANGIKLALQTEQIGITICRTIAEARQAMTKQEFHLLLLDINLPDGSGLDFLQEVRKTSQVPTIFLTANDMEIDIVTGLEMGADDYVTKPFSLAVLRARVHTQLRRSEQRQDTVIEIDDFSFDFLRMIFKKGTEQIELSKTEQKLLRLLVENKGVTLERAELVDRIWTDGSEYVDENALSVTVKRLRDKLEDDSAKPKYVKTVYGIGYTWEG